MRELRDEGLILAYHDRSDGGLAVTLLEMAFAAHCGLRIDLGAVDDTIAAMLFRGAGRGHPSAAGAHAYKRAYSGAPCLGGALTRDVGEPVAGSEVLLSANGNLVYSGSRIGLHRRWSEVSFRMQALRDNPQCAQEEYSRLEDVSDPGLHAALTYDSNT